MADVLIDPREGSAELLSHFPKGVAEYGQLEYGDAAFLGTGPDDRVVPVGVEVKQLTDALQCIVDGRFAGHQLPGLAKSYRVVYLVVTGLFKADDRTGLLLQRRGSDWREVVLGSRRFMASEFESWLLTLEQKAGIRYRHATSTKGAARFIYDLYRWWSKGWDAHRSHVALHSPAAETGSLVEAGLKRQLAKELPGVGWKRSIAVAQHFTTVVGMMTANEKEWMKIEGIGKKTAADIVKQLREEK